MFRIAVLLLCLLLAACGGSSATPATPTPAPHARLNGTWQSDIFTVTIDFTAGTYKGVSLGQPFDRKLTLVSEQANVITFQADDITVTAQLQADGSLMLTRQGGVPVKLTKAP